MNRLLMGSGWSWNWLASILESVLGNQQRMFVLILLGMCLALYIITRSRV